MLFRSVFLAGYEVDMPRGWKRVARFFWRDMRSKSRVALMVSGVECWRDMRAIVRVALMVSGGANRVLSWRDMRGKRGVTLMVPGVPDPGLKCREISFESRVT